MARPKSAKPTLDTADYRHTGEKRTRIPLAKIAAEGKIPRVAKVTYRYSPHRPPVLRFDPTGQADKLPELVRVATERALTAAEAQQLATALRQHQPWLEWANKQEEHDRGGFEVDPVALHIHERVSAQAIVRLAMRQDIQRDLFADPQQPYHQAVQFYKHDMDWANRLILGDSLQVMSSLARREDLAGKVQMIYMDPPYGIKFGGNFQPEIGKREVKDGKDSDLTREPETVRAFRDTWRLGTHSYLSYLRDRLLLARELLADSGSIFVQISDVNMHRVRALLDETLGPQNYLGTILFAGTTGQTSVNLAQVGDYLLWYAKDKSSLRTNDLYLESDGIDEPTERYVCVETPDGEIIDLTVDQKSGKKPIPPGRILKLENPTSQTGSDSSRFRVDALGTSFRPGGSRGWSTSDLGIRRLLRCRLMHRQGNSLWWKSYRDRGRFTPLSAVWTDKRTNAFGDEKLYVVRTGGGVIERCVLLASAPCDLVLDPTCGSGTTAFVAEQWGRRWITIDTSRVALAIARQRLLSATYPHYRVKVAGQLRAGFTNRTMSRVTLKNMANDPGLDAIADEWEPRADSALAELSAATGKGLQHWSVPFETPSSWWCPELGAPLRARGIQASVFLT